MTVRQLFYACENFKYDDIVTVEAAHKVLYKSTFIDVLTTVYAEYTVRCFDCKLMRIEVL